MTDLPQIASADAAEWLRSATPGQIIERALNLDDEFSARYDRWAAERRAKWTEVKAAWLEEAARVVLMAQPRIDRERQRLRLPMEVAG